MFEVVLMRTVAMREISKPTLESNFASNMKQMAQKGFVSVSGFGKLCQPVSILGNDKKVDRCLWVDVSADIGCRSGPSHCCGAAQHSSLKS